jgi:anti-sigma B factor antagonist
MKETDLIISVEERKGKPLLRLKGRLDAETSSLLEKKVKELLDSGQMSCLIDCQKIDYLSSAGLRLLLVTAQKLKTRGGSLILFSLSPPVLEIIQMAGFDKILTLCPTEEGLAIFDN